MKATETNILIYQADDGRTRLDVQLEHETVWLTQKQMAELFTKTVPTINEHIKNIFKEGELAEESVVRKSRITAADGKTYDTAHYNLDVIISVGYRVKSKRGTQFRQWATRVLRDHLVKGYTVHEQRLREESAKFKELRQTVDLLARTLTSQELVTDTGKEVLQVITDYAYGLALLDRYDHGQLTIEGTTRKAGHQLDYDEAIGIVTSMKGTFDGLFGVEKDQGFKSALGTIYQTFDGKELYPSVEEKAANLLYFVVKNHAFSDGNKRIAAALFVYFMAVNQILYRPDGSKRLADNALVALTLLIAESRPEEKETIVKVIVNLINQSNE
ncbi:virulence protein RhuM/Fic/DOC family protein [Desulfuromonas sp. KJ2020]|uniref:virulence protein RhuM/Fic/DOC family protein n=1 Tax=Desulfuromonas sp. KJ2020 TaxID=2919173 RepID=UPI0020A779CE|nr:virulence protein RhuM/Fic/DOC family protein [Desulfuromonas sp. KJ2020]MCP3176882.1 virulence protein RhuM/Fic/DOC family protein [Desulfuromonas sp. KJ2020]